MDEVHEKSILLIGPANSNKSIVANLLSEKTNMPTLSLDTSREKYYCDLKYDREYANKLKRENGELARYEYNKPFEAHYISNFLDDLSESSIIKFESTQTVYEQPELFAKVYNCISKFANVILLLPDIDLQDCWQQINRTCKVPVGSDLSKLNWHLVSSPCNSSLATYTVYMCGRDKEEITDEILEYINSKSKESVRHVA